MFVFVCMYGREQLNVFKREREGGVWGERERESVCTAFIKETLYLREREILCICI